MKTFRTACFVLVVASSSLLAQIWGNGPAADCVIGKTVYDNSTAGCTSVLTSSCTGVAIDLTYNKIYVSDFGNNRVLRFAYPVSGAGPTADMVFGQADFVSNGANRSGSAAANTLSGPYGVAVCNGDLWVADAVNNRVLKYARADTITTYGPNADVVLGQSDFASTGSACTQTGFSYPAGIWVDAGGRLWVADTINNRVLRFDNASAKSNGGSADGVLGQPDFVSSQVNQGGTPTASTLYNPVGVAVVRDTLYVADTYNNRVLRFNNASSKANGAAADGVYGQADFTSQLGNRGGSITAGSANQPRGVAIDSLGDLYYADSFNHRVLVIYGASGRPDGCDADAVIGQVLFTTGSGATQQTRMNLPVAAVVDNINSFLFVAQSNSRRVTRYPPNAPLPVQLASFTVTAVSSGATLSWTTATETDCYGFEVERREVQISNSKSEIPSWVKIGFVEGSGTSSSPHTYSYADADLVPGRYAYRLNQIDRNGTSHCYNSTEVEIGAAPKQLTLSDNYPNPFNPATMFQFSVPENAFTTVRAFNILGQEVAALFSGMAQAGRYYEVQFDGSKLASGVYYYALQAGNQRVVKRMVLMK